MKFLPLLMLGSAVLLGGCASTENNTKSTTVADSGYVGLGSNIPKKGGQRSSEDKALDLQQLENQRTMNNGVNNGPGVR